MVWCITKIPNADPSTDRPTERTHLASNVGICQWASERSTCTEYTITYSGFIWSLFNHVKWKCKANKTHFEKKAGRTRGNRRHVVMWMRVIYMRINTKNETHTHTAQPKPESCFQHIDYHRIREMSPTHSFWICVFARILLRSHSLSVVVICSFITHIYIFIVILHTKKKKNRRSEKKRNETEISFVEIASFRM